MAIFTIFVIFCFISTALACNGYEAKNLVIEDCSSDRLVTFDKLTPELKDDCTVVIHGCIIVKQQIEWANGTYKIEKKGMGMPIKFTGKEDLCTQFTASKKNPEVSMVFSMMDLEQKCPIKKGKVCGNAKALSIAKYKDHFKMIAGDYEGQIEGKSNAGTICIKIRLSVVKKGGGGMPSIPKMG